MFSFLVVAAAFFRIRAAAQRCTEAMGPLCGLSFGGLCSVARGGDLGKAEHLEPVVRQA